MTLSRRQLLGAAGLAGTSLLLDGVLRGRAKAEAPPKRVLVFYTQHGVLYDNWRMRPAGVPADGPASEDWEVPLAGIDEAAFSEILRPLYPIRSKIAVLDGLSFLTTLADRYNLGVHAFGQAASLTGRLAQRRREPGVVAATPGGMSVDQFIADAISVKGRIHSLQLRVGSEDGNFVAREAGQPLPFIEDPLRLYASMFPLAATPGTAGPALDAGQARVHAFVQQRYRSLLPKVSTDDRARLEAHRQLLADLETRMGALRDLKCDIPPRPSTPPGGYSLANVSQGAYSPELYDQVFEAHRSLLGTALSCDVTRVAVLQMSQPPARLFGAPDGDVHFGLAHISDDPAQVDARRHMTNYHRLHANQFRRLVEGLDAIPDAAGGTLLDHTTVVWMSEVGSGSHRFTPFGLVVAGGGAFRPGRYIRWQERLPRPFNAQAEPPDAPRYYAGPPHNKFLTWLCNAAGVPVDRFGLEKLENVPLSGGQSMTYDLTGVLDRLS